MTKMLKKKTWKEFRNSGLLWFINRSLHLFGWAIVYEFDGKKIKNVYPARCKFRGFDDKTEEKGFKNVTKYLKNNIDEILNETEL